MTFMKYNFKLHPVIPNNLAIFQKTKKDLHSRVGNISLKTRKIVNREIKLILVPGIQSMYR